MRKAAWQYCHCFVTLCLRLAHFTLVESTLPWRGCEGRSPVASASWAVAYCLGCWDCLFQIEENFSFGKVGILRLVPPGAVTLLRLKVLAGHHVLKNEASIIDPCLSWLLIRRCTCKAYSVLIPAKANKLDPSPFPLSSHTYGHRHPLRHEICVCNWLCVCVCTYNTHNILCICYLV